MSIKKILLWSIHHDDGLEIAVGYRHDDNQESIGIVVVDKDGNSATVGTVVTENEDWVE